MKTKKYGNKEDRGLNKIMSPKDGSTSCIYSNNHEDVIYKGYEDLKNIYIRHLKEKGKTIREEILYDLERIRGKKDKLVEEYKELISKFSIIYEKYLKKENIHVVHRKILEIEDEVISEYLQK